MGRQGTDNLLESAASAASAGNILRKAYRFPFHPTDWATALFNDWLLLLKLTLLEWTAV